MRSLAISLVALVLVLVAAQPARADRCESTPEIAAIAPTGLAALEAPHSPSPLAPSSLQSPT